MPVRSAIHRVRSFGAARIASDWLDGVSALSADRIFVGSRSPTVISAMKWAVIDGIKLPVQARTPENKIPTANVDTTAALPLIQVRESE